MQLSLYSVGIGMLIALILLIIAATKRSINQKGAREVYAVLILVLVALCFFELSLVVKSDIRFFLHELKFTTLAYLAPCTLFVYMSFAGKGDSLSLAQKLMLCVIPFITVILAVTNGYHHFFRLEMHEVVHNGVSYIEATPAWWYWIYTVYSYILYITGVFLLTASYYKMPRIYRNQIGLMILTIAAAIAVGAASMLGVISDYGDIGLVSGSVVCIVQYITIVKYSRKIIVTKARNLVVSDISSAVLIFDHTDKLIDSNKDAEEFYDALNTLASEGNMSDELFIPKSGKYYSMSEKKLYDDKENAIGRVVVLNDITGLKTTVNELEHVTTHDYLTGLKNRQTFHRELRKLDSAKLPAALIYVNISGMNIINNIFGYEYGDNTIIHLADEIIGLTGGGGNLCARLNGHEFGAVLANAGEDEACEFIRKLQDSIQDSSVIELETAQTVISDDGRSIERLFNDISETFRNDDDLFAQELPQKFYEFLKDSLKRLRDKTGERYERILELCKRAAEDLRLTDEEKDKLLLLSVMSDIGLLSASASIVENIGGLTNDEWEEMKLHTVKGHNIALTVNEISCIAKEILSHHERYDGYGYPQGLKGEEIPYIARIYSAVELFADTPPERLEKLLTTRRGTQLDPVVADVLLGYLHT